MGKLPTTPNNLQQPSPDTQGLEKTKPGNVDVQAAEVNRDVSKLQQTQKETGGTAKANSVKPKASSKPKIKSK